MNPSLTLAGTPPEALTYRLGSRSALEWVVDQYRVTEDDRSGIRSDPNREDDPPDIVRLVGQVVRVSMDTVRIVGGLPAVFAERSVGRRGRELRAAVAAVADNGVEVMAGG